MRVMPAAPKQRMDEKHYCHQIATNALHECGPIHLIVSCIGPPVKLACGKSRKTVAIGRPAVVSADLEILAFVTCRPSDILPTCLGVSRDGFTEDAGRRFR